MNDTEQSLLALLRIGLGNTKEGEAIAPSIEDWEALLSLAEEQTVCGTVASAFDMMPPESLPQIEQRMRWVSRVMAIERENGRQDTVLSRLIQRLREMGLTPILMKGQAFASAYPAPMRRQPGDIDIYFKNREECSIAVEWAKTVDPESADAYENQREKKHFTFHAKDTEIELHYFLCLFEARRLHRRLQDIIDAEFAREEPFYVSVQGTDMETVPPTLSVLHQIIHMARHLMEAGIGLRQLCDMAMFLRRYGKQTDAALLRGYLRELQLERMAAAIGYILNSHLGVPEACIPFQVCGDNAPFIMREIFEGGNFGKNKTAYRSHHDGALRKTMSALFFLRRCIRYSRLMPEEARSYFLNKIRLNANIS